jgi:hypothetical protein
MGINNNNKKIKIRTIIIITDNTNNINNNSNNNDNNNINNIKIIISLKEVCIQRRDLDNCNN